MAKTTWDPVRFGKRIVRLREEKGLKQATLARKAKIARASLRLIENGQSKRGPKKETIIRLLSALDTTEREFYAQPLPEDFDKLPWYDPDHEAQHAQLGAIMKRSKQEEEIMAHLLERLARGTDPPPRPPSTAKKTS